MQLIESYSGGEQRLEIRPHENQSREMQDLLSRCLPSFQKKAYRYLGNAADAEDAVQDALVSAYKHLDQFRGEAQFSTWLTAILINCARMQLRKRSRIVQVSLDEQFGQEKEYSLAEQLADRRPTPEDECRTSELHDGLMELVKQLSPPLRRAFQLRDLDGLTTREAAETLGVAEGTVKAQLTRARAKLRRLMGQTLDARPRSTLTCDA